MALDYILLGENRNVSLAPGRGGPRTPLQLNLNHPAKFFPISEITLKKNQII